MSNGSSVVVVSPKIQHRQGRTRRRILDESARLFIARGFENVSVEEIIAAAGIARSSFYRFFSNREDVLTQIIRPVFERAADELAAIRSHDPRAMMDGIFTVYVRQWRDSPDALRVSTRVGGVHFSLFKDVHDEFRRRLLAILQQVEATGVLLNGSADYTGRLIARTAVPTLEVYAKDPDFERLFYTSMRGLLLVPEEVSP
jgi:AcrR family transcriptional regulator